MTVHELYNQKKKEYEKYQIDKGIYESRLSEAEEKLDESIKNLEDILSKVDTDSIHKSLEEIVSKVRNANGEYTESFLREISKELESVGYAIEQQIRSVLEND